MGEMRLYVLTGVGVGDRAVQRRMGSAEGQER